MSCRNICIKIPQELKDEFQRDKYLLETIRFSPVANIEKALTDDNICVVLDEVGKVTNFSSYGHIEKKGFFKNFSGWLDFSLMQLMNARGISISDPSQRRDLYLVLYNCQKQLSLTSVEKKIDSDFLVKQAEYFTHKTKCGLNYNPQIIDMCSLFIDIGLGIVSAEQLADISYGAYLKVKNDSRQLIFGKKDNQ